MWLLQESTPPFLYTTQSIFLFLSCIYVDCDVGSMDVIIIAFMQGDQGKEQPCSTMLVACHEIHYATY
jgi:hypothetical protein